MIKLTDCIMNKQLIFLIRLRNVIRKVHTSKIGIVLVLLMYCVNCFSQPEYELAVNYQMGKGHVKNFRQAVYWYERLVPGIRVQNKRDGILETQHNTLLNLALCNDSLGNYQKALEYYQETYSSKISDSCRDDYEVADNMKRALIGMIRIYHLGLGVEKDSVKVKHLLHDLLMENGRIRGRTVYSGPDALAIAYEYMEMPSSPENNEMALFWIRDAMKKWLRYPYATYVMGELYEKGLMGIPQNYEEALKLYEKADADGYLGAKVKLGYLYEKGTLPQNYEKAFAYYQQVIDTSREFEKDGRPFDKMIEYAACGRLGVMHYYGYYVKRDLPYSYAMSLLGVFNENAEGVEDVMVVLANCYCYGLGTKADKDKEMYWLKKAKAKGSQKAERFLMMEIKMRSDKDRNNE